VGSPSATLAPGASYTTVTVTVPAGTPAGKYYAILWAGPKVATAKTGITLLLELGDLRPAGQHA
jgi:hypothetical protein